LLLLVSRNKLPRKKGEQTPFLGIIFIVPIAISLFIKFDQIFLLISILVILLGIIDDIYHLKPFYKLLLEIIIGILYFGLQKNYNPILFLILIFILNSFNLADGIDGLLLFICILWLGILFYVNRNPILLLFLFTSIIGLIVNFPPAKMFLGDCGSLFLGFLFFYLIENSFRFSDLNFIGIAFLLCSYPFIDTLYAVFRRLKARKNPFKGDKKHIHHLLKNKLGNPKTIFVIFLLNLLNSVIFITLYEKFYLQFLLICSIILFILNGVIYYYESKN
jgi:UDP-GlcNAc:undecaprenyl-phosphate GlcNAc-1-phosphate transferase